MLIYIIVLVVFLILFKSFKPQNKTAIILGGIILFTLSAFRGIDVGTDTIHYLYRFESPNTHYKAFEFVWYGLNTFIYNNTRDFQLLLVISSLIIVGGFCLGISKSSKNYVFSLILFFLFYYFFESLNIVRQYMAMSIIFLAATYFSDFSNKRKLLYFLFLVFFAASIHTSAIFALVIPFINFLSIRRFSVVILLVASLIIGLFPLQSQLQSFDFFLLSEMYNHYLEDFDSAGVTATRLLMNAYILFVLLSSKKEYDRFDKYMLIGICLQNAFPYAITIRLFSYLIVFSIISIPNRYEYKKSSHFLIITLAYGLTKFFVFLQSNVSDVVPYVLYTPNASY